MVDRNNYSSAQQTPQKYDEPFSGVFAPQKNSVAFSDVATLEFAREAICLVGDPPVAEALHAIAALLPERGLLALRGVSRNKLDERLQLFGPRNWFPDKNAWPE
jgi:hypothetical protein